MCQISGRLPLAVLTVAAVLAARRDTPVSSAGPGDGGRAARGDVTGTVRTATGEPVAGVAILPRSVERPARPVPELLVATDRDGRYRWRLDPGRYELVARRSGPEPSTVSAPRPVTVVAGRTERIDFTMD